MYYEINVAKKFKGSMGINYKHFFATAPRSITSRDELKSVYAELKQAFPKPMYDITISYNPETSTGVNIKVDVDDV